MPPKPKPCHGCSYELSGGTFVPPDKPGPATLLEVYGEAPGQDEANQRAGFVGASGKLLRMSLTKAGIGAFKGAIAANNIVRCKPDFNRFPGPGIAAECQMRHEKRLDLPVLACGSHTVQGLTGLDMNHFSILDIRGSVLPRLGDGWITATIHPAFVLRGGGGQADDALDKRKGMDHLFPLLGLDARRALESPGPIVPAVAFRMGTEDSCRKTLEEITSSRCQNVAIDLESQEGRPALVGVSWSPNRAVVMPWSGAVKDMLQGICDDYEVAFHNAAYDVAELQSIGIDVPNPWVDTINTGALVNPSFKMGLQAQVLTYVKGTTTWKGLVDHNLGPTGTTPKVHAYRQMWTTLMQRINRLVPTTGGEWYAFYNGLDVAWTYLLLQEHKKLLRNQGV